YVRLRLSEGRSRVAVFGLLAMGHDGLNRECAGHLAMRFAAHAIRQNVQVQSCLNFVAVFIVLSDASEVGARPGFYTQRGLMRLVQGCGASNPGGCHTAAPAPTQGGLPTKGQAN